MLEPEDFASVARMLEHVKVPQGKALAARFLPMQIPGGDVFVVRTMEDQAGILVRFQEAPTPEARAALADLGFASDACQWHLDSPPGIPSNMPSGLFVHFGVRSDTGLIGAICDEVLSRISSQGTSDLGGLIATCQAVAASWAGILSAALKTTIPKSIVVGMYGELISLECLAKRLPGMSISEWTGPSNDRFDFRTSSFAIEVKSTTLTDRWRVMVHGLDQLEAADVPSWLLVLRVELDPAGRSIGELVDACKQAFPPDARNVIDSALQSKGFTAGAITDLEGLKFRQFDVKLIPLQGQVPQLTARELAGLGLDGYVSEVQYALNLASILGEQMFADAAAATAEVCP